MNRITKTESPLKYAQFLLIGLLSLVVAIGIYFTDVKIW